MNQDEDVATPAFDDEYGLPKATVAKMIQELMPPGLVCPRSTRDIISDCCIEFIHMVSSEANEVCEKSSRKTISPEHVFESLASLGFDNYVSEAKKTFEEFFEETTEKAKKAKSAKKKWDETGMSTEELLKEQEELFRRARERMQGTAPSSNSGGATAGPASATDEDGKE